MKNKSLILLVLVMFLTSCGAIGGFPTTSFYVKNNSEKPIKFKSTVYKYSSMGNYDMTIPFIVKPKDSVLARQVGFKKDGKSPQSWFTKFEISETEGVRIYDPNKVENWKKMKNKKGQIFYVFTIAE
ncbi:hypothetical protein [Tenacibaculum sp. nBUS_03]|uniref:hypothetical protein n=1 Tax=Tenacibaculum sp. nBUS_03 TaxID=3395320 RepID=UPI003EB9C765